MNKVTFQLVDQQIQIAWCNFHFPTTEMCSNVFFCLLPPANEVWGKVIFSEACVKNSVHGGVVSQYSLQQGGLQAHTQGEVEGSGQGGSPGPHPGGKLRGLARGNG